MAEALITAEAVTTRIRASLAESLKLEQKTPAGCYELRILFVDVFHAFRYGGYSTHGLDHIVLADPDLQGADLAIGSDILSLGHYVADDHGWSLTLAMRPFGRPQPGGARITSDNIRRLLASGGYQRQSDTGETRSMPHREALLFALCDAAEHHHLELARELIAEGADLRASVDPLIAACESGDLPIVQLLVEHGAEINARGQQDDTPLMNAASHANLEVVQYLLKVGAERSPHDLKWLEMGAAAHNWPDGMSADVRYAYDAIRRLLTEGT
jgi:hypothetical protein